MIRCQIACWSVAIRRFELVGDALYAATPAIGSFVHFRVDGERDSEVARVVEIEYHPERPPILRVVLTRDREPRPNSPARWSPELLHEGYDLLMACYMKDRGNHGKRLSNTTLMELMLWSAEQVRTAQEGKS